MNRLSSTTDKITAGQSPNPFPERPKGIRKNITKKLNSATETTAVQFLGVIISFTNAKVASHNYKADQQLVYTISELESSERASARSLGGPSNGQNKKEFSSGQV